MAAGAATRLAGKALGDFLKFASGYAAEKAADAALRSFQGQEDYADAPGLRGRIAADPEKYAKRVGRLAPIALTGGLAAGAAGASALMPSSEGRAQSAYSLPVQQQDRVLAYETQSALEQQKFQHQLALIQARQTASTDQMQMGMTTNMVDPMFIANQMFKPQGY